MATAIVNSPGLRLETVVAIGTHRTADLPAGVEWHEAAHPIPDSRSVAAAERALEVAAGVGAAESLVLALSGGASALMALPIPGLTLADKQACIRTMMLAGADIRDLNTVRKHLSAIKGGRLAAACGGRTVTLAVSDVVGDDLAVIGSGPGVADPTTWRDVAVVIERFGGARHALAVRELVARGTRGDISETPKPDDPRLARSEGQVIASQQQAVAAAAEAATALGYRVVTFAEPVTGEAREVARQWFSQVDDVLQRAGGLPLCILSAGETTVRVTGSGRGGRNQEFVLALVDAIAGCAHDVLAASVGTDGIDGPTDAAGAMVDRSTRARASALHVAADRFLHNNDSYEFFARLGDLIHLGRTDTNVGDLQIALTA